MAPTFKHGKGAHFSLGDTNGTNVNLSSGLDDLTLDTVVETADVTTFGDNDRVYLAGLRTHSFSASGHFASTYEEKLRGLLGFSTASTFDYSPHSTETGNSRFTGSVRLTGLNVSAPVGDKVGMDLNFQITGAVTSTSHA